MSEIPKPQPITITPGNSNLASASAIGSATTPMGSATLTEEFFRSLDSGINTLLKNKGDEPYHFHGNDMLVQTTFSLPVPCLGGSLIKYSFSTKGGDIQFSTHFVPKSSNSAGTPRALDSPGSSSHGLNSSSHNNSNNSSHNNSNNSNTLSKYNSNGALTIVSPARVASDVETIFGSYRAQQDGTFYLEFDNSYSWFTPKQLSYNVELLQPAFSIADRTRCTRSQSLLKSTIEDSRRAELRLLKVMDRIRVLNGEIPSLEERFAALQADLNNKRSMLANAQSEASEIKTRLDTNLEKRMGLCIRCLPKPLLTKVLEFLGPQSSAALTCKYWQFIFQQIANSSSPSLPSSSDYDTNEENKYAARK